MNKGLRIHRNPLILLVGRAGIEPTTNGLKGRKSVAPDCELLAPIRFQRRYNKTTKLTTKVNLGEISA